MIAFVVSVNGKPVATVGIGESGVLTADVVWSGSAGGAGDLRVMFGGLDSRTNEHVRWPEPPELQVGDTVSIRVIETDAVDPPIARKTPAQLRQDDEALLADLRAKHPEIESAGATDPPPVRRRPRNPDDELPPLAAPWE
jgi:hypothetical protein